MYLHAGRNLRPQRREKILHTVRNRDGVGPRLPLNRENDRTVAVVPARDLVVLHVVHHVAELVEVHRRAVAVRDDHLAEFLRILELSVGLDRRRPARPPERAGRHAHILIPDRVRHFVDPNAAIG